MVPQSTDRGEGIFRDKEDLAITDDGSARALAAPCVREGLVLWRRVNWKLMQLDMDLGSIALRRGDNDET